MANSDAISLSLFSHILFSVAFSLIVSSICTDALWICIFKASISLRSSVIVFRLIYDLILNKKVNKLIFALNSLILVFQEGMFGLNILDLICELDVFMLKVFKVIEFLLQGRNKNIFLACLIIYASVTIHH